MIEDLALEEDKNSAEDDVDLLSLFGVIFRYKLIILLITLSAAIVALIFSFISIILPPEKSYLPNKYQGHALILVREQRTIGVFHPEPCAAHRSYFARTDGNSGLGITNRCTHARRNVGFPGRKGGRQT